MAFRHIRCPPFDDQKPGTSGLRQRVEVFQRPHYLERFVQAIFTAAGPVEGATLVLGGDGRHGNDAAIRTILRMAAANGVARVLVGRGGLLSTPAASCLIRKHGALGAIVLTASHNPGGPEGDFGVKFNTANGGPAPPALSEAIHRATLELDGYRISDSEAPALDEAGDSSLEAMRVSVIDPVADYAALMESLFDFEAIGELIAEGVTIRFDAMHGVTGPYAIELLERRLGAPSGSVMRAEPLRDFGGTSPDPNPVHTRELMALMASEDAPDLGAASDGDGDRNLIVGPECYVSASDSLALLAAYAWQVPMFADGLAGVARSMPTSRAVDRVAAALGIDCYETPTGWKYFGNLLDAGRVSLCGEESFGTGGYHLREKDGLWAVLFWLNLLAVSREPVSTLLEGHWARFGRDYYTRHDYEGLAPERAAAVIDALRSRLPELPGQRVGNLRVTYADDFGYRDPVDGSEAHGQGIRVHFDNDSRAVYRLSGTGTAAATLRVYIEAYEPDPARQDRSPQAALAPQIRAARELARLRELTGRDLPDVTT